MVEFPERKRIRLPWGAYACGYAFSMTIVTHERYPWFGIYPEFTREFVRMFLDVGHERRTVIYAWCIMPDHVHLLLHDADVVDFVRLVKGRTTPIARRFSPGRRLWQRSFYDHGLRTEESLEDIARYIWGNPVRKGMVARASSYEWSGSSVWPNWKDMAG